MHPTNTGPIIFNFGVFLKEKRRKEKRERERTKSYYFPNKFYKNVHNRGCVQWNLHRVSQGVTLHNSSHLNDSWENAETGSQVLE